MGDFTSFGTFEMGGFCWEVGFYLAGAIYPNVDHLL